LYSEKNGSMLRTFNLTTGYIKGKTLFPIQSALNLTLEAGEMVCLIGRNGTGKSTLLRTLAALQPALEGNVTLCGKNVFALSPRRRAHLMTMVLTERIEIENATVQQVTAMGRQPYTSWWGTLTAHDKKSVEEALELTNLGEKAQTPFAELSDGERQRTMLARALAQETPLILLDEPTAHLDLPNRVEIFLLLHRLARQTGRAILLSTHELDLALQTADHIWLMRKNEPTATGRPQEMLENGEIQRAFAHPNFGFEKMKKNTAIKLIL